MQKQRIGYTLLLTSFLVAVWPVLAAPAVSDIPKAKVCTVFGTSSIGTVTG